MPLLRSHGDFMSTGGTKGQLQTVIAARTVDKNKGQDKSTVPPSIRQQIPFPQLERRRSRARSPTVGPVALTPHSGALVAGVPGCVHVGVENAVSGW